jgi:glyoxylate reductase
MNSRGAKVMLKKVVITQPLPGERLKALAQQCDMEVLTGPQSLSEPAIQAALAACHGLICLLTDAIDRTLLDAMPNLRFVSSVSVGVDHIDVESLTARGIPAGPYPRCAGRYHGRRCFRATAGGGPPGS